MKARKNQDYYNYSHYDYLIYKHSEIQKEFEGGENNE